MKQGGYAIADTLRIGGLTWLNVPFAVIDTQTGHEEADKYNEKFQLPPVIGLPVMLCMQEIQLDFAHREIIIPAIPTPNPLGKSNLIRTDTEGLQLKTPDETGNHVYFHFDTGCYYTYMQPTWYNRHKKEVDSAGVPDSLRMAGIGGVSITRTYKLPYMKIRIGNGTAMIDSVNVNTGIDLHSGQVKTTSFSDGAEDGVLGLNALEKILQSDYQLKGYVYGSYSIYRETVNALYSIEFKGEPDGNVPNDSSLFFYSSKKQQIFHLASLLDARNTALSLNLKQTDNH